MAGCVKFRTSMLRNIFLFAGLRNTDSLAVVSARNKSIISTKLVYSEYGEPAKVVRKDQEEVKKPSDGEVVVKMLAAPINPADINTIQGVYPVKPSLPAVPGNEGIGKIIEIGNGVTDFKVGDRVLPKANALGTWRTHLVCKTSDIIKISDKIGILEAATLTVNPCTAYRMLRDFVPLSAGDTVIQNGANSAAGQNVIQLCKAWGFVSVNIVRNRSNIDELKQFLTDLGADHVLTEEELRSTEIFKKEIIPKPRLALNCVGGKNALEVLRHLDMKGVMVTYGGMSREPVLVPTSSLIFKDLSIKGYWMTRWSNQNFDSPERFKMLDDLVQLIVEKKLKPPVNKLIPVDSYVDALAGTMSTKGFSKLKYILDFQGS